MFGDYLKSLRKARGMTLREAGQAAQISNGYLSQIEQEKRQPPGSAMLCRLARVYQVPEEKMLQEAGHLQGTLSDTPAEIVDRAFRFVCDDPKFVFGTRLQAKEISLDVKMLIVEMYQKYEKRTLLKKCELGLADEAPRS